MSRSLQGLVTAFCVALLLFVACAGGELDANPMIPTSASFVAGAAGSPSAAAGKSGSAGIAGKVGSAGQGGAGKTGTGGTGGFPVTNYCSYDSGQESQCDGLQKGYGPVKYSGGRVMTQPINVYHVWYGDWEGNTAPEILEHLIKNFGESKYHEINTTYYQELAHRHDGNIKTESSREYVSSKVTFVTNVYIGYPYGTSLTDKNIRDLIFNMIDSGVLPKDENSTFFVLTSKDVESLFIQGYPYEFCGDFCGWHYFAKKDDVTIKYAFIGDPDRCPDACGTRNASKKMGINNSPNNNWAADDMASVLVHELSEMVTDPEINAWRDDSSYETSDKCAWIFGSTYCTASGARANVKFGARDFLVQENWVNDSKCLHCTMKL